MEKKLMALVFIALLIGLGAGYGLGYVIYQPRIESIRRDLDELRISKLWHKVTSFTLT